MELRYSSRTEQQTIYLRRREPFPSFGFPKQLCPHPAQYSSFAEWESDSLGHGWFCALCGELLQVG